MPSFDIVSKTDLMEVDNAINNVLREVKTRFDFKGSKCSLERTKDTITLIADDDLKLRQLVELLKVNVNRRNLDHRCLDLKPAERATGESMRQTAVIKQGINNEVAKDISKEIRNSKIKVQVSIQGDELRISGKKRDDLQQAIALAKKLDLDQPLQFVNMRD